LTWVEKSAIPADIHPNRARKEKKRVKNGEIFPYSGAYPPSCGKKWAKAPYSGLYPPSFGVLNSWSKDIKESSLF
jgi:hypothetical protein